jgi:hypothetical protein
MRFRCSIGLILLALAACAPLGGGVDESTELEESATLTPVAGEDRLTEIPEPGAPAAPTREAESEPAVPDLVWLPFSSGLDESRSVLAVRAEQVGLEPSPVDFSLYWDYSGPTGRLAYASQFWHAAEGSNRSVSDLWVYDYTSGKANQWVPDNVGRASWSPMREGQVEQQRLAAAIYDPGRDRYDLALLDGPFQSEPLANCASPSFTWSPDGTQIAYTAYSAEGAGSLPGECQGVFLVSVEDGLVTKISDQLALSGGWIGDRPVWAEQQGALLFAGYTPESIFWVVPLDGSGAFQPALSASIGEELPLVPMHAIWSSEHRSLVGQIEGMADPLGVWIYSFSDDLRTIEQAYRVNWGEYRHDLMLVDWWEPGQSVLMRDITNISGLNPFGVAVVWDIGERSAFELASSRSVIEVPLHPQEVRTGVEPVDRVLQIFLAQAFDQRMDLIRTLTTGCTTTEYFVGPPLCRAGQVEGTPVEVFPYRMYRASHFAASDELETLLEFPLEGLYAVHKIPEATFKETWWPAGEYSVVFASAEDDLGVEVVIEGGQVVRIEFWPLTPVEVLNGAEFEYLLAPLNQ